MTNQSFHLFQLQKLDSRLAKIEKRKNEISASMSDRQSLDNIQKKYNHSQDLLNVSSSDLQKIEKMNQDKNVKIEQSEASLYSGTVKNPKELADLQLEIASLRKTLQNIENDQISLMVKIEELQQDYYSAKEEFFREQAIFAEHNSHFLGELSSLDAEISKIMIERRAILHQVQPDTLQMYEKMKISKKGIAVSTLEDRSCTICGAELTPSECQQAKLSQQMAFCPSCGRILYAG